MEFILSNRAERSVFLQRERPSHTNKYSPSVQQLRYILTHIFWLAHMFSSKIWLQDNVDNVALSLMEQGQDTPNSSALSYNPKAVLKSQAGRLD